jgi:energy-coupling factor transporter transmembrane protein EcfT
MAELGVLSFRPGNAFLHRLDVRFKLIALILVSLATIKASALGLGLASLLLLGAAVNTHLSLPRLFRELRYFLVFLLFVWLARSLTVPGQTLLALPWVAVTREGSIQGALVCWRLVLVVLMGALIVTTSRSSEIRRGVEFFLKPLPFVPHKRIGTMLGLMVRFIPVTFEQIHEIMEAQLARAVDNRKNPFYRLPRLLNPILRKTFVRADQLAIAMEARCYTEGRSDPRFAARAADWVTLSAVGLICLAMTIG